MKIINFLHLAANFLLLVKILVKLFTSEDLSQLTYSAGSNSLAEEINILKFLQLAQLTDFVFSSGDKFSIFLQLSSRISLPWIFMISTTSSMSLYVVMICWTIADSIRYTFYLVKGGLISALRYNMFIVLYPLGVAHEFMVVKSFFDVYKEDAFPEWQYYFAWMYDIGLFAGLPILYTYMLNSRKRYYKKLRGQSTPKAKSN